MNNVRKIKLSILQWTLFLFAILSIGMIGTSRAFQINSYLSHPQFSLSGCVNEEWCFCNILMIIDDADKLPAYYNFFYVDFLWAPVLLILGGLVLIKFYSPGKYIWLYVVASCISLFLDYWENLMYIMLLPLYEMDKIIGLKMAAYGLTFLVFLYQVYRRRVNQYLSSISIFFRSSFGSILNIALILGLLGFVGQGSTLIVELFETKQFNLFIIFILLFFLAVILSHYPAYFEARLNPKNKKINWTMVDFLVPKEWFGLGLVYYETENGFFDYTAQRLRHYLGLGIFTAFFYVLLSTYQKYYYPNAGFSAFAAILFLGFFIWVYRKFHGFLITRENGVEKIKEAPAILLSKIHLGWLSFILAGVSILATTLISFQFGWSQVSIIAAVICMIPLTFGYIVFRLLRKESIFKDNKRFVSTVSGIAIVLLLPLIAANLWDWFALFLNPIIILMLYIIHFYGAFIIISKHIQYFLVFKNVKRNEAEGIKGSKPLAVVKNLPENPRKWTRCIWNTYPSLLPYLVIVVPLIIFVALGIPNDLHVLQEFANTKEMELREYLKKLPQTYEDGEPITTRFQVASYGGGLKANLWNMLVLDKLENETCGRFLRSTLSISSVSGGTIGVGNYSALWASSQEKTDPKQYRANQIYKIGAFNHLAIDITYVGGRDLVQEIIPINNQGTDRSYAAMKSYALLSGLNDLDLCRDTTYRATWKKFYLEKSYFPIQIVNSFSTNGQQGVALSVKMPTEKFETYFPGAINTVDKPAPDHKSVSYYGALSTSNRFPIMSPAAVLKFQGHFLDGGYFDNSGISSSFSFIEGLKSDSMIQDSVIKFLVIDNSSTNWIKHRLKAFLADNQVHGFNLEVNHVDELSNILQGAASLDKMPNYFENLVDTKYGTALRIYLPQPISYQDIVSVYKGNPLLCPELIMKFLKHENETIRSVLDKDPTYNLGKWGLVSPPLARLNSEPAIRYQQAMINYHPYVKNEIEKIRELVGLNKLKKYDKCDQLTGSAYK